MSGSGGSDGPAVPEQPPPVRSLDVEEGLDAFERDEVVGRGGNATVHLASPRGDGQVVALKEPHVAADVPDAVVDRFRAEAETWASLDDHDHVVAVHAWGTDPHPWLALEYADGGSLAARTGAALDWGLWVGACVATAVGHAHAEGVAHLDLKPENVLLVGTSGDAWAVPKVADWGMARALGADAVNLEGLSPRYAAPEQFAPDRFGPPGAATDVYGLGVVLYELLVGTAPFDGPPRVLREAVLEESPPPASGRNPDLPVAVDDVLDRALAKAPGDRYDSMDAFRRELERLFVDSTGFDGDAVVPGATAVEAGDASPGPATDVPVEASASSVERPFERALALADEGFVRLSERYFGRREPAPPLDAWRRGVTLADARAGRAVERTVPEDGEEGARRSLTDRLLEGLADGVDHVVLGPPGSGKSTVCKQVACEWFDGGHGPVFYRESGRGSRFERPDALARGVSDADGHALVVVEDAVRPDADAAFEFLDRVADADGVTVLLDARESEWRDAGRGDDPFGADPVTAGREALEPVYVPRPDRREHERFVAAVEDATDRSLDVDVAELRGDVERAAATDPDDDETRPGELFYLLHRLTALVRDPLSVDERPTTLIDAVAEVADRLAERGEDALDVGVCANVCNAAGVGVHPELLYAVAPDEPLAVDDAIEVLDGTVLFPRTADWSEGTRAYPAVHEAWSTASLAHLLDREGEAAARDRFGRVATRLLALADEPGRRERVDGGLAGAAPYLARVADDPTAWADETVEALYDLGRERPKLAPLFGDGEDDSLALPAACSEAVVEKLPVWLGRMFEVRGDYDRAERAYERLPEEGREGAIERVLGLGRIARMRGEFDRARDYLDRSLALAREYDRPPEEARTLNDLGIVANIRGERDRAREQFEAALEIRRELDDRSGEAASRHGLGMVALKGGRHDRAREQFEAALDIRRDLGDRNEVADGLNMLGVVLIQTGDYEDARELFERSIEIKRAISDSEGEASALMNLGTAARMAGDLDRAREYYETSLDVSSEIGHTRGEASCHNNLGILAKMQGEFDEAREYFEASRRIKRDQGSRLGEANSIANLGTVAMLRGDYDTAEEYLERCLETYGELGNDSRRASSLNDLGRVLSRRGEHDRARDCHEESLEIATETDDTSLLCTSHHHLGLLAHVTDDHERARDHLEKAFTASKDGGERIEVAKIQLARGRLALDEGDVDLARQRGRAASETFRDLNAVYWAARTRRLLGRVAAAENDGDAAREHCRTALETFEDVGAPQDTLATLQHLVEICRETGDDEAAERWCRRARATLIDAPEPVTDQHREWVNRECDDE